VALAYPAVVEQLAATQAILPVPSTKTSPVRGAAGVSTVPWSTTPLVPFWETVHATAGVAGASGPASPIAPPEPPELDELDEPPEPDEDDVVGNVPFLLLQPAATRKDTNNVETT
jgi:hypothetical protein